VITIIKNRHVGIPHSAADVIYPSRRTRAAGDRNTALIRSSSSSAQIFTGDSPSSPSFPDASSASDFGVKLRLFAGEALRALNSTWASSKLARAAERTWGSANHIA